jgi:hypothetical protein
MSRTLNSALTPRPQRTTPRTTPRDNLSSPQLLARGQEAEVLNFLAARPGAERYHVQLDPRQRV